MNFPLTRHDQRYEYILGKGYVKDRTVLDVGCSENAYGSAILSAEAKQVIGIDPALTPDVNNIVWFRCTNLAKKDRIQFMKCKVEDVEASGNTENTVAVCMEVLEHVTSPEKFISHLTTLARYAFITTPMAKVTGKTRNLEHVAEYSSKDFQRIVGWEYKILDIVYQHGDLRITKQAKAAGDSLDAGHVVQMAWCERR